MATSMIERCVAAEQLVADAKVTKEADGEKGEDRRREDDGDWGGGGLVGINEVKV
jgi:hypothetical protein